MRNGTRKLPELLAPAGSRKAFLGALAAGADAVYLGGEKFGARAYAENFTQEDIVRSIREAHLYGRKVYLTLNVLTKETELKDTVDFAVTLYRAGLDGVIVQDLGVLDTLHRECPGLDLHASTQMSVAGPEGVRFLKEHGVRRVVPARELSLEEIRTIKREEPIDVECFIHGAMCYSYSGRCLLSSFLGGRSGNRGRCAGTCRLPYKVIDSDGKNVSLKKGKEMPYPLSMRDMCVLEILPDLIDAGIDSFKIEGRMKSPHYAAGVTALYRKYIDYFVEWDKAGRKKPWKVSAEDMKRLRSLYIRSALSTGYYYKRNGKDLLTIEKPGYAGTDDQLLEEIEEKYLKELPRIGITGKAVFAPGEAALMEAAAEDPDGSGDVIRVQVQGDLVQKAQNRPMDENEIGKRLRKTGDSLFIFRELEVETRGDIFMPVAALNALRRDALAALENKILEDAVKTEEGPGGEHVRVEITSAEQADHVEYKTDDKADVCTGITGETPTLWAQVTTVQQLRAAQRCGISHIIVEETPGIMNALTEEEKAALYIALPPVCRSMSRAGVKKRISEGYMGVLIRNLEELVLVRESGYSGQILADGSLYQWNTAARDLLLADCDMVNQGWELSAKDMQPLKRGAGSRQLLTVYGRLPMMITAGCVRKTAGACSHTEQDFYELEDRKGIRFPVRCFCAHCSNVIYNSLPLSLHSFIKKRDPEVFGTGGWILSFTTESGKETEEILRWYRDADTASDTETIFRDHTTGHFRKSAI